jgi:hypothetical protein
MSEESNQLVQLESAGFSLADIEELDRRHSRIGIDRSYSMEEMWKELTDEIRN